MTLQEATLEQLKALAYDTLVQIEQHNINLKTINAEISKRNEPMENEDVVVEETTEATPEVVEESAE